MLAKWLAFVLTFGIATSSLAQQDDGASLEPEASKVIVAINVAGAVVRVNGQEVGRSPLSSIALSPGDQIGVQKEGFAPANLTYQSGDRLNVWLDRVGGGPEPVLAAGDDTDDASFPWLWVGVGGAVAAAAAVIVVIVASSGSQNEGINIPGIE